MGQSNEELVRRYFAAAGAGDMDTLNEVFADDIVAHIGGNHALSGDYRGKQEVFGFFGQLAERSGGTAQLHLRDVLADNGFAIALVDASGQVGDHVIDGEPGALVLRIQDGRFVEFWSHHYDQKRMDEIWS